MAMPVSTRLDEAGLRRKLGEVGELQVARDRPDAGLVDLGLDERVHHRMLRRREQSRAIVAEIVEIGARGDRRRR